MHRPQPLAAPASDVTQPFRREAEASPASTDVMLRPRSGPFAAARAAPPDPDPTMLDLPLPQFPTALPYGEHGSGQPHQALPRHGRIVAEVIPAGQSTRTLVAVLSLVAIMSALLTVLYLHARDARARAAPTQPH